jgi:hypothetical protein
MLRIGRGWRDIKPELEQPGPPDGNQESFRRDHTGPEIADPLLDQITAREPGERDRHPRRLPPPAVGQELAERSLSGQ